MATIREQIKQLLTSLQSDTAGAAALSAALVPLVKRSSGAPSNVSELIDALEKRDHGNLWKGVHKHVEAVVSELQAADDGDLGCCFEPVGKEVEKAGDSDGPVRGRVVEVVEGPADELLCSVAYDDGSTELFPFTEARDRCIDQGGNGQGSAALRSGGLSCEAVEALAAVATLALAWVSHRGKSGHLKVECPAAMVATAALLHDVLFDLSGLDGLACQEAIARLCEAWWVDERPGAELLVAQLLPYLLVAALSDDARDADVKRLFAVRGALLLLDFEDESSETLKGLLLRCAMSPRFLGSNKDAAAANKSAKAATAASEHGASEGRRFLVFLFGVHPSLVEGLHTTVKNQLPLAPKKAQQAYGDLYLRAWKNTQAPVNATKKGGKEDEATSRYRRLIEACIQDLMSHSLHAAAPKTAAGCRAALSALHENRSGRGVEAMLGCLWEPLLFRATKVANPSVRANAATMLQDAFPLVTSGGGNGEGGGDDGDDSELLQRQFDSLRALLGDKDPSVRALAASAAGCILGRFWEAIPPATSRVLLTVLLSDLAGDGRSPLVRAAAVDAVTLLLDQPLAHSALKAALPSLQNLIHDSSEKVRVAMCGLLRRVSTVRGIKFTSVAPLEHLLARLKADFRCAQTSGTKRAPPTVALLTRLLVPSFFPASAPTSGGSDENEGGDVNAAVSVASPEDGETIKACAAREKLQLGRALHFLRTSPGAALAFYATAHEHVDLGTLCRLVVLLASYAHTAAKASAEEEAVASSPSSPAAEPAEEGDAAADDDGALAPATPDKRDKRKRKGKKAAKGGSAGAAAAVASAASAAGLSAGARLALVEVVLRCAAVVWESVAPALVKAKGSRGKGVAASASAAEAAEERSALAHALGRASALPALYELLLDTSVSAGPIASAAKAKARAAVLRLAACLRPEDVPALSPLLVQGLSLPAASDSGGVPEDFAPAVALLCKWGSVDAVASLMAESLTAALAVPNEGGGPASPVDAGKRKRGKKPSAADPAKDGAAMPLALAVRLLRFLASGRDSLAAEARAALLAKDSGGSQGASALFAALASARAGLYELCIGAADHAGEASGSKAALLVACVEVHGRLLLHKQALGAGDKSGAVGSAMGSAMEKVVAFAAHELLPLALATAASAKDDDDLGVLSPVAKAKRCASSSGVASSGVASSGAVLAGAACGAVLAVCGDWAACGMGMSSLSAAAASMVTAVLASSGGGASGCGDLCVPPHAMGCVKGLGRLAFLLAAAEPHDQEAKAPPEALRLLFRAAHIPDTAEPATSSSSSVEPGAESVCESAAPRRVLAQLLTITGQRRSLDAVVAKLGRWIVDAAKSEDRSSEDRSSEEGEVAACFGPSHRGAGAACGLLLANHEAAKLLVGWLLPRVAKIPAPADSATAGWVEGSADARILAACCRIIVGKAQGAGASKKDLDLASHVTSEAKRAFNPALAPAWLASPVASLSGAAPATDPRRALLLGM